MIGALIAAALLPADQPIEPIDTKVVDHVIEHGLLGEHCLAYMLSVQLLDSTTNDLVLAMEIADTYVVWVMEGDYGPNARVTAEARTMFTDWFHENCVMEVPK